MLTNFNSIVVNHKQLRFACTRGIGCSTNKMHRVNNEGNTAIAEVTSQGTNNKTKHISNIKWWNRDVRQNKALTAQHNYWQWLDQWCPVITKHSTWLATKWIFQICLHKEIVSFYKWHLGTVVRVECIASMYVYISDNIMKCYQLPV